MNKVQTLLTLCRALGVELTPTTDGKLKVRAPAPLPEDLRAELKRLKADVLALLNRQEKLAPWPCPHCGNSAVIEDVCPSRDGQRTLTLWCCERCQIWAVTPSTLREPPVWVSREKQ